MPNTTIPKRILSGAIGEIEAETRFLNLGFYVYKTGVPLPWDMLIERSGKFYKVQCKYRTASNGTVQIKNRHWVGMKKTKYTQDDIDILTVYCPDSDQVYLIRSDQFTKGSGVTLRLYEARNNQKKDICLAKDYINPDWLMSLP